MYGAGPNTNWLDINTKVHHIKWMIIYFIYFYLFILFIYLFIYFRFEDVSKAIILSSCGEVTRSNPGNAPYLQLNFLPPSPTYSDQNLPLSANPLQDKTVEACGYSRKPGLSVDLSSAMSNLGALYDLPNETCNSENGLKIKMKDRINAIRQNSCTQGVTKAGSRGVANESVSGKVVVSGDATDEGMASGGVAAGGKSGRTAYGVPNGGVADASSSDCVEPTAGVAGGGMTGGGGAAERKSGYIACTEPIENVGGEGVTDSRGSEQMDYEDLIGNESGAVSGGWIDDQLQFSDGVIRSEEVWPCFAVSQNSLTAPQGSAAIYKGSGQMTEESVVLMNNDPLWCETHSQDRKINGLQIGHTGQVPFPPFTSLPSFDIDQDLLKRASQANLEEVSVDDVLYCLDEGKNTMPVSNGATPPPNSYASTHLLTPAGGHVMVTGQAQVSGMSPESPVCHLGQGSEYANNESGILDASASNSTEEEQSQHTDYLNDPSEVMRGLFKRQCSIHDQKTEPSEASTEGSMNMIDEPATTDPTDPGHSGKAEATGDGVACIEQVASQPLEYQAIGQPASVVGVARTAENNKSGDIEESLDLMRLMKRPQHKISLALTASCSTTTDPGEANNSSNSSGTHPLHTHIKYSPSDDLCYHKSTAEGDGFSRPLPVSHSPMSHIAMASEVESSEDGSAEEAALDMDADEEDTSPSTVPSSTKPVKPDSCHPGVVGEDSSSIICANNSCPNGSFEAHSSVSPPRPLSSITWMDVFNATCHTANDQLVFDLTVRCNIPEVRSLSIPSIIEGLSQLYHECEHYLRNCPPHTFQLALTNQAKLCKVSFIAEELRIVIQLPLQCK